MGEISSDSFKCFKEDNYQQENAAWSLGQLNRRKSKVDSQETVSSILAESYFDFPTVYKTSCCSRNQVKEKIVTEQIGLSLQHVCLCLLTGMFTQGKCPVPLCETISGFCQKLKKSKRGPKFAMDQK